jgi:DAPG hydrolase PhiG domain
MRCQCDRPCGAIDEETIGRFGRRLFDFGQTVSSIDPERKLLTPIMNKPFMRRRNTHDTLVRDLLLHCAEEMRHLAKILPELYKRFGPKNS